MQSLVIFVSIILILDGYCLYGIFRGLSTFLRKPAVRNALIGVYLSVTVLLFLMIIILPLLAGRFQIIDRYQMVEWISVYILLFYVPKIFFIPFVMIADILRLMTRVSGRIIKSTRNIKWIGHAHRLLLVFPVRVGCSVSVIIFLCGAYGASVGRYDIRVKKIDITFAVLPPSFDNFKIVQISDWHIGTFKSDASRMRNVVNLINAQGPDAVMFTGDIINFSADELNDCHDYLTAIEAKSGKYTVLGNHDGEHRVWQSCREKTEHYKRIFAFYDSCGFRALRNDHVYISKGHDSIAVCGVNYWISDIFKSVRNSPFADSAYWSDLNKAVAGINSRTFKVLMAHDPLQWDEEIVGKTNIDLTLSGHTHGGQVAMHIGDYMWSPAGWFYDQWYGLYQNGRQYLYVNPGLGYIGLPARIGIPPEITVITMKKQL